ncbi:hypothetical protein [Comamonas sp. JC664]|uniref:hypothetical protein n=1 Tax=Comamonas sp. JC664 TaxID=2801917 RepID=UPI00360D1779
MALTNAGGARPPDLRLGPDLHPANVAAHRHGVPIIKMQPFAARWCGSSAPMACTSWCCCRRDGAQTTIRFDEPPTPWTCCPASTGMPAMCVSHQTPAQPPRWLDIRLADGQMTEVGRETWSGLGLDPAKTTASSAFRPVADDGQWVPLTVLSRKDIDSSQPQPLLLTGYGAYGIAHEASFSLPALAWVDAGYRYAIAMCAGARKRAMTGTRAAAASTSATR